MKTMITLAIFLSFASSSTLMSQNQKPLEKLVKTEQAFAAMAREKSVRQAFIEFLAEDGVLFQPTAVNGKKLWQARPESPALLAWSPVWADISGDGSIGYTTGEWSFRPQGKDDDPVAFGQYFTIWKLQDDGNFKAVLDIGISHKKPERLIREWTSPKSSTNEARPKTNAADNPDLKFLKHSDYSNLVSGDFRLFREGSLPFIGKENALKRIQSEQSDVKSGRVKDAKFGGSGDLRYGFGVLELSKKNGTVQRGNLLRVWKRNQNKWQLTIEVFAPIPAEAK